MLGFKSNGSNQANNGPLIKLSQVVKTYHGLAGDVVALKGIDLQVRAGEFVAITGPSGSGKSTIMHLLGCLDRPTRGHVAIKGVPLNQRSDRELAEFRNHEVGFVFQHHYLLDELDALDNVALPLRIAGHRAAEQQHTRRVHFGLRVGRGDDEPGFRCDECGYLTTQKLDKCLFCGGQFVEIPDAVEAVIAQVVEKGGTAEVVDEELMEQIRIGALLRY